MTQTTVRGSQLLNESVDFALDVSVPVTTLTSGATLTYGQTVVLCDTTSSAFTVTLPSAIAPSSTQINGPYQIKNIGTNALTIATTSSQTIDGSQPITVFPGTALDIVSDNTNWRIV